jgi:hypothetical protein
MGGLQNGCFRGAKKIALIYTGLEDSPSKEDMQAFLTDNGIKWMTEYEELWTRGLNKSFKMESCFSKQKRPMTLIYSQYKLSYVLFAYMAKKRKGNEIQAAGPKTREFKLLL